MNSLKDLASKHVIYAPLSIPLALFNPNQDFLKANDLLLLVATDLFTFLRSLSILRCLDRNYDLSSHNLVSIIGVLFFRC
jgi:hypothetical protein